MKFAGNSSGKPAGRLCENAAHTGDVAKFQDPTVDETHRLKDFVLVWLIVLAFMCIADWRRQWTGPSSWLHQDGNHHLGAEYDAIARSIRDGEGFSNPFKTRSGPTAWMPPILPYLMAFLYWCTGDDRSQVISIILILKALVLVFTGLIVIGEARRGGQWKLGFVLLIVGYATHFRHLFQLTHDSWLLLLVINLLWLSQRQISTCERNGTAVLWGLLGGFAVLCSPVLGLVWAVMTIIPRHATLRHNMSGATAALPKLALSACACAVVVAPWAVRNKVVFDKWIPIKSNGLYEVWQALCVDDDGVLDRRTLNQHPWGTNGPERRRYLQMGEIEFIGQKREDVESTIRNHPAKLVTRMGRRLSAAVLYYTPYSQNAWQERPGPLVVQRILFPVPFICWLLLIVLWRRRTAQATALVWIYAVYLVPYVLVSYYERYAVPLVAIKMLLVLEAGRVAVDFDRNRGHSVRQHARKFS